MSQMDIEELISNFQFLDSWEEKYRYIIELGESLPQMDESKKTPETKVEGCQSQVWFDFTKKENQFYFIADSDSAIVKGLEAVLISLIDGKTAEQIKSLNIEDIFAQLGLSEHLSPTRRNGFFSMVNRIHQIIDAS